MFNLKIVILLASILIFIIPCVKSSNNETVFGLDCLIHNQLYSYEYLYSSNETRDKNVYLIPLGKVDNFAKLGWSIIRTENRNREQQFYLKSSYTGDYLCVSVNTGEYLFQPLLKVERQQLTSSSHIQSCRWTIKKEVMPKNKSYYSINSAFYGQSIYPTSSIFRFLTKDYKRQINLWIRKVKPDSKKFKWNIDCSKGNFMWI